MAKYGVFKYSTIIYAQNYQSGSINATSSLTTNATMTSALTGTINAVSTVNITPAKDAQLSSSISATSSLSATVQMSVALTQPNPYALSFDGVNDYVDCGSSIAPSAAVTMEAWVKPNTFSSSAVDFVGGRGDTGAHGFWLGVQFDGKAQFAVGTQLASPSSISLGQWTHLAGTWDGTTQNIYINGVLSNSVSNVKASIDYTGIGSFKIGNIEALNASRYWDGTIDEVRIWNVARTQAQISANMNNQLIGNETGIVNYWKFDEGTGLTAYDSTINANNGTLVNGVAWVNPNPVTSSMTAIASVSSALTGSISSVSTMSANTLQNISLVGSFTSNSSISGLINGSYSISSSINGISTLSVIESMSSALSGSISALSNLATNAIMSISLTGTVNGVTSISVIAKMNSQLSGSLLVNSSINASILGNFAISSSINATSSMSAIVSDAMALIGSIQATSCILNTVPIVIPILCIWDNPHKIQCVFDTSILINGLSDVSRILVQN